MSTMLRTKKERRCAPKGTQESPRSVPHGQVHGNGVSPRQQREPQYHDRYDCQDRTDHLTKPRDFPTVVATLTRHRRQ